jgi:hypothetical protein
MPAASTPIIPAQRRRTFIDRDPQPILSKRTIALEFHYSNAIFPQRGALIAEESPQIHTS